MKILITGATGFVGSHLVDHFVSDGHEVYALFRSETKLHEFSIKGIPIKGDFSNFAWLNQLPTDLEAVIHTAGLVHASDTDDFYKINVNATVDLINQLKDKYSHLIFGLISSQAASGPSLKVTGKDEQAKDLPVSHYGKSKLLAENKLTKLSPHTWKTFIIRPPMVIGPRDFAMLSVFKIVKTGLVPVVGNPDQKIYSFVSIFDLVKGITAATYQIQKSNRQIFYIAHPQPVSYRTIISAIRRVMTIQNQPWFLFVRMPSWILLVIAYLLQLIKYFFPPFDPLLTPDKIKEIIPNQWVVTSNKSMEWLQINYNCDLETAIRLTYEDYKGRSWL
ncbi:MAG: hypothetical protein A2381_17655 [Bdellovibrionales bacterium RIFOXYB1_FULL_37_110]|nr:MAG: hypothetical protein A2181_00780 [Bdellovibrionales bacterium RIFOXYA1_FULL_38_20]OFZ48016.1 MAG: hypothetical protein A2417_15630 [Bdellovibrionales bacterium RIFOXYC1_FULL_37_79]OFZ58033.1 MAG: hypothetical protein A2381_17655 [Bdellovibrionales bacterium RIFOXYB1_FULL_37_110]OFZ61673.1 MAG: hypothetical protein A2577_18130 [Bdellovibrionales bacterium RIFOXYD1_FULL_36_51]